MSRILVDELVNLAGTDKVTFAEGLKVTAGEALDLDGAKINIDTGVGLDNQLLASTGSGLKWVSIGDTNSTYAFSSVAAASNDVKLKLTGSGDAAGYTDQVTITGTGTVTVVENAGVITINGSDQNTTYDLVASTVTDGAQLTLTGTDSSNDIFSILGGSNITVARSGTDITISSALSGTVGAPSTTTDGGFALFDGTDGTLLKNSALVLDSSNNLSGLNDVTANSFTSAADTGNLITFWYDQQASFPNANTYQGAFAFSDNNDTMHYAAGNSWYQIAKIGDIIPNTDTTYSIALTSITNGGTLSLNDSNGIADSVNFLPNSYGGVGMFTSGENLYIDSRVFDISAQVGPGTGTTLRLRGTNHDAAGNEVNIVNDDILLTGADGLTVELTDANTITFRQSGGGSGSYTDNDAKDAAAQALLNGTSLGISFSYDSGNKTISAQVGTVPTTFNFTTGSETDNYLVTGSDRGNTYSSSPDPSITIYEGDTITFDNTATRVSHPMYIRVSDGGSSVSSPAASGEGTATTSWTPTSAGTYYYQCGNHPLMIGTITVLSTGGGGGGGSSVLYDLYGTNTTSNNVLLNLDPSLGLTDQIEFAGGDATTISWDATNKRATISSPVQVQSDWSATSGLGEILNKPTIPTAYTLPQATTTTLGGVIIGDGLNLQPSGEIETSLQIITDASNTTTNDLSAAGFTLNTNYTTVSGATGDIKRIGDLPHYHDGTDWRPFYLTGTAQQAASSDVNFDDVQVRMNFDDGTVFNHVNRFHAKLENLNPSNGAHVAVVTSPVKYGSHSLKIFNQPGTHDGDYVGWTAFDDSDRDSIWGVGALNPDSWWNAKRGGCIDWTQDWTLEFWIRFDDIDTVQTPRGIFTVYETNYLNNGAFGLSLGKAGVDPTLNGWALYWNNMRGSSSGHSTIQLEPRTTGSTDYVADTWYFISLTFVSSTGELILHRDGVNVSTSIAAANRTDTNLVSANGSVNSGGWKTMLGSFYARDIGNIYANYKNNAYFDDIRFTQFARYDFNNYTAPTSALPITADAPPTVDPDWTNVIVRNTFNTNFNDISQYAISPTGAGASLQTTNVKYGAGALRFTATNSYLEYYDDESNFDPSGTFTAEFWINWDTLPTSGGEVNNRAQTIWSQTTPSTTDSNDYSFGLAYTTNFLSYDGAYTHGYKFFWRNSNASYPYTYLNLTEIPYPLIVGSYNHVALVRDGNGVMTVFFNGFKLRYNTGDTAVHTDTQVTYDVDGDFRIGSPQDPGSYGTYVEQGFEGYIDDFRITNDVKYTDNFTPPSAQLPTTGTVVSDPETPTSSVTGLATRADLTGSVTIDDNATGNLNITGYKAYTLLKIQTDADAWVRVYTDDAARTADSARSEGEDPGPGDGVIAEVRGSGVIRLSPAPFGYNNDSPNVADAIYTAVTNRSGSTATINVTLTAIRLEA